MNAPTDSFVIYKITKRPPETDGLEQQQLCNLKSHRNEKNSPRGCFLVPVTGLEPVRSQ